MRGDTYSAARLRARAAPDECLIARKEPPPPTRPGRRANQLITDTSLSVVAGARASSKRAAPFLPRVPRMLSSPLPPGNIISIYKRARLANELEIELLSGPPDAHRSPVATAARTDVFFGALAGAGVYRSSASIFRLAVTLMWINGCCVRADIAEFMGFLFMRGNSFLGYAKKSLWWFLDGFVLV